MMHEDLPAIAIEALEHGHDGPVLRRIAGFVKPIASDIAPKDVDSMFREMNIEAPLSMQQAQLALARETAEGVASNKTDPFNAATHVRIYICGLHGCPPELAGIVHLSRRAESVPRFSLEKVRDDLRRAFLSLLSPG